MECTGHDREPFGRLTDLRRRPAVGLVVVSHSRTLARSAVALAAEMLHGRPLRIEVAAGLDETTFGTDAVAIMQAIEQADGPAGVVVLMDLGSAVLSAELALDLLQDPSIRERVTLSPAPTRRGAHRCCRCRRRRSQPGRGRGRGAGRTHGQVGAPVASTGRHHNRCGRRRNGGGRRRLLGGEPARPSRPAGCPAGQRGPCARRVSPAAQPHYWRLSGPCRKPEPGRDARRSAWARGRGSRHRSSGPGGGRAPAHARRAQVRRDRRGDRRAACPVHGRVGQRPPAGLTRDRDRPASPPHRSARRPRPATNGGTGRGMATHRGVSGRRTPRHRARPGRHRPRSGGGAGEHLRRAPLAARRRRDARRRQDPHQHRGRGGLRLGRLSRRRRARMGEPARPLPEGTGRGRPRRR